MFLNILELLGTFYKIFLIKYEPIYKSNIPLYKNEYKFDFIFIQCLKLTNYDKKYINN